MFIDPYFASPMHHSLIRPAISSMVGLFENIEINQFGEGNSTFAFSRIKKKIGPATVKATEMPTHSASKWRSFI